MQYLFIILIALVIEFSIIIILFFERASLIEQFQKSEAKLLDELSRMTKAVISKNANEYVMTTSIDKVPTEDKDEKEDPDEIPEETLSDDEFMRAIEDPKIKKK